MVSSTDFGNSLTVDGAASSHYALQVMSVVAADLRAARRSSTRAGAYYVFRARVGGEQVVTPLEKLASEPGGSGS